MFTEVVKLTPKVDRAGLNLMFQTLNQRFTDVTRRFGSGLKSVMKFGGAFAIGGAILNKLLNPLQRTEEVIDRILAKGDDAATNAEDFNTTPGKLLRLEGVAATKGLSPEHLTQLMTKFQSALAKESEDMAAGGKGGTLREYVGEKDIAEGFFKFVQSIQKLDPTRRVAVQDEVFGERARGRAREFLNAKDFGAQLIDMPSAEALTEAAERIAGIADQKDKLDAIRALQDLLGKSYLVNEGQNIARDKNARRELKSEDEGLKNFVALAGADAAMDELLKKLEKTMTDLAIDVIPNLVKAINGMTEMLPSKKTVTEKTDAIMKGAADASVTIADLFGGGKPTLGDMPSEGDALRGAVMQSSEELLIEVLTDLREFNKWRRAKDESFEAKLDGWWAQFKNSPFYKGIGGIFGK